MIPRVTHRIWLGSPMPAEFAGYWNAFGKVMPPPWSHVRWDDQSVRLLLDPVTEPLFEGAPPADRWRYRSDIARLRALYEHGGVYVDADVEPLRSFEPLIADGVECFLGWSANRAGGVRRVVSNAVMGAVPGHPFVGALLEALPERCARLAGKRTAEVTGPLFVDELMRTREWSGLVVYPESFFYPQSITDRRRGVRPDLSKSVAFHRWANTRDKPDPLARPHLAKGG